VDRRTLNGPERSPTHLASDEDGPDHDRGRRGLHQRAHAAVAPSALLGCVGNGHPGAKTRLLQGCRERHEAVPMARRAILGWTPSTQTSLQTRPNGVSRLIFMALTRNRSNECAHRGGPRSRGRWPPCRTLAHRPEVDRHILFIRIPYQTPIIGLCPIGTAQGHSLHIGESGVGRAAKLPAVTQLRQEGRRHFP